MITVFVTKLFVHVVELTLQRGLMMMTRLGGVGCCSSRLNCLVFSVGVGRGMMGSTIGIGVKSLAGLLMLVGRSLSLLMTRLEGVGVSLRRVLLGACCGGGK